MTPTKFDKQWKNGTGCQHSLRWDRCWGGCFAGVLLSPVFSENFGACFFGSVSAKGNSLHFVPGSCRLRILERKPPVKIHLESAPKQTLRQTSRNYHPPGRTPGSAQQHAVQETNKSVRIFSPPLIHQEKTCFWKSFSQMARIRGPRSVLSS